MGRLPVVSVEAEAPDTGNFSWRDHFKRLLDAMREPLIEYKLDRKGRPRGADGNRFFSFECGPQGHLAPSTNMLLNRRFDIAGPSAVLIDEAQHLAKMSSGRRLLDQLDVIKSDRQLHWYPACLDRHL